MMFEPRLDGAKARPLHDLIRARLLVLCRIKCERQHIHQLLTEARASGGCPMKHLRTQASRRIRWRCGPGPGPCSWSSKSEFDLWQIERQIPFAAIRDSRIEPFRDIEGRTA